MSITALRRFSLKKLRISDGIFVILLMALSFEYVFLLHLIYSFSAIRGNTQSLFYAIISYPFLNPKLEFLKHKTKNLFLRSIEPFNFQREGFL